MYKCVECGGIFEEPKRYCDDYTPGGAFEGGSFMSYYNACPYCASNYDEAQVCVGCGKYKIIKYGGFIDGEFYCDNCKNEIEENEDI